MVKLILVAIYRWRGTFDAKREAKDQTLRPVRLAFAEDLTDFNFFKRQTVRETLHLGCKELVWRTPNGGMRRVNMDDIPYFVNIHVHTSNLAAVVVSDGEYPKEACFNVSRKAMRGFATYVREANLSPNQITQDVPESSPLPWLGSLFNEVKGAPPNDNKSLEKAQEQVEAVCRVMEENITVAIGNQEKLDELMQQSEELSATSKSFLKTAKKTNKKCCSV